MVKGLPLNIYLTLNISFGNFVFELDLIFNTNTELSGVHSSQTIIRTRFTRQVTPQQRKPETSTGRPAGGSIESEAKCNRVTLFLTLVLSSHRSFMVGSFRVSSLSFG